jgi:hypothetical protein
MTEENDSYTEHTNPVGITSFSVYSVHSVIPK